jgi:hypothetical protein
MTADVAELLEHAEKQGRLSETDVERIYMAATGVRRRPTCVQLERMMRTVTILSRKSLFRGGEIETNIPELARLLGLPITGLDADQIAIKWGTAIRNTLAYLQRSGLIEGWRPTPTRRGILVDLRAGVAQLVRAAES